MLSRILDKLINLRPAFPARLYKLAIACLVASVVVVPGAVWMGLRIPAIPFLNGMAIQSAAKAQTRSPEFGDGVTLRSPVEGTVPRSYHSYPYPKAPERAAAELVNPLPKTMDNLRRGEVMYDTFCQPCHGYKGVGDGSATGLGRLPAANTLHSDKVRKLADGAIYHIITEGQNKMPSYAYQIAPMDRWAAVDYVRVLQRAMNPKPEDLPTTGTAASAPGKEGAQ